MRYISRYGKLTLTLIRPDERPLPNGKVHIIDPGFTAEFRPSGLQDHEYEFALRNFHFNGVNLEEDGVTPVSVRWRIGVWDSDQEAKARGWDEETKKKIEGMVESAAGYGVDFIAVGEPKLAPPWPTYDSLSGAGVAAKIKAFVEDGGFDPSYVIAYERQNKNRASVIEALEQIKIDSSSEIYVKA